MMQRVGRVGIAAALAGEVAPLVRSAGLKKVTSGQLTVFESDKFVVAYAGMGRTRALEACAAVAARGPLSLLISAGWAGSLHAGIQAVSVHRPVVVLDAASASNERFEIAGGSGLLVTVGQVVNIQEKRDLAALWGADLVDMETAHVARFAQQHDLPFACVRAVSDAHDQLLPDFERFSVDGQFQTRKFVRWVLLRPQWWPGLLQMGRNSAAAAKAMCAEIERNWG